MPRVTPLAISLSPGDTRPIGRQLADRIRLAITTGELPVGARLPSVRALAAQLLVNSNTVAKVYLELSSEGWLHGHHGQGVFVAGEQGRLSEAEMTRRLGAAVDVFVAEVIAIHAALPAARAHVNAALDDLIARKVA
ncbi:Transcriptional regulator with HTH domain protein and aminotransferase domain protein [Sphingopyxis sp. LC81]|uniref:GntR family transcriptional regulator n=1 Tax=Sphingopyxis sp. LC81 TaxID=1502850 RepID=UPI00050DD930|nr:GntR family transcriptional regulator [Sphingopyxis sp. LC81]KGB53616.1 Transcriptional regulator with HTH domain protein and aminotransferase domain protein [Sphingopyxis sp. LC81]